jgi:hypothetical protein
MNGETPLDPEAFLQLALSTRGPVPPLPHGFENDESQELIDRAARANRRLAEEIEQLRKHAIESALAGAENFSDTGGETAEPAVVAPDRESAGQRAGLPPQFSVPIPPPGTPKWQPTHVVPSGGIPAWRDPDPALPPTANLPAQLPVRVLQEVRGWAQVKTAIGRTWWLEASRLEPIDPPRY